MGDVVKLLLVKLIRLLIADAEVAPLVVVIVKIVGHAGLGVGQVGKNRPVAGFELLGFQAGPQAPKIFSRFSAWALSSHSPRRLCESCALASRSRALQASPTYWPPRSECTIRLGAGRWASSARCKALATRASGISARTCQPTTCLLHASWKAQQYEVIG